jgi:Domain of unknown function (DUF4398)
MSQIASVLAEIELATAGLSFSRNEEPVRSVKQSYGPTRSWVILAVAAMAAAGCGNALYSVQANSASGKLEEARELGAEQYAPYEYFYAKEHLQKARTEAAEADYGDAVDLAQTSEEYSDKAIRLTREAHRGAGR